MTEDALSKQMHKTAIFLAERLLSHPSSGLVDCILFAKCFYLNGETRRCLAFLENKGLLSAGLIRTLSLAIRPSEPHPSPMNGYNIGRDVGHDDVVGSLEEKLAAVQLASQCLFSLEQYEDCLLLIDPIICVDIPDGYDIGISKEKEHILVSSDVAVETAQLLFSSCASDRTSLNVMSGLYTTAGKCLDKLESREKSIRAFVAAIRIDLACTEALDYLVTNSMLTISEKASLFKILKKENFVEDVNKQRGWLWPYFQFMLGDGTPDDAIERMVLQKLGADVRNTSAQSPLLPNDCGVGNTGEKSLGFPSIGRPDFNLGIGMGSAWLVRKAEFCYNRQFSEDAYKYARLAYTVDPFDRSGLFIYIASMVDLGLKTELFYLGHELVHAYPKQAISWYTVGCYYWVCKKFEISQKYLQRATKIDRRSHYAWIALGHVLAAQEESEHAISAYRSAYRLAPGDHRPLCYMAKEMIRTSNLSLGLHILLGALEMSPDDPAIRNELGVVYMKLDRLEDACSNLKIAAESVKDACLKLTKTQNLGVQDIFQAISSPAVDQIAQRGKLSKSNVTTPDLSLKYEFDQSRAGQGIFLSRGSTSEQFSSQGVGMSRFGNRVVGIGGSDEIFSNYATCLRNQGKFVDALYWYDLSLSHNPSMAMTHAHMGFTYHLMQKFHEAIESYHRALGLQPTLAFCGEMLSKALSDAASFCRDKLPPMDSDDGSMDFLFVTESDSLPSTDYRENMSLSMPGPQSLAKK